MPLTEFAAVLAVLAWMIVLPRVADARGPLTDDPDMRDTLNAAVQTFFS